MVRPHNAIALAMRQWPGTATSLALAMRTTRQSLWMLERLQHRTAPLSLLRRLASVLQRGTADGSKTPTRQELVAAWRAEKAKRGAS